MLDGGPSRVPQPVDRRGAYRPETARRYADEQPRAAEPETKPTKTVPQPALRPKPKTRRRLPKPLLIGVALIVLALLGWLAFTSLQRGAAAGIDTSKNQAVFFTNGQTYFGKLEIIDNDYLKLRNVFYIRSNNTTGDEESEPVSTDMQLIKRGEEVYGPEDAMIINRDQVLYFENLKPDSQVSELMRNYKQ